MPDLDDDHDLLRAGALVRAMEVRHEEQLATLRARGRLLRGVASLVALLLVVSLVGLVSSGAWLLLVLVVLFAGALVVLRVVAAAAPAGSGLDYTPIEVADLVGYAVIGPQGSVALTPEGERALAAYADLAAEIAPDA